MAHLTFCFYVFWGVLYGFNSDILHPYQNALQQIVTLFSVVFSRIMGDNCVCVCVIVLVGVRTLSIIGWLIITDVSFAVTEK